MNRFLKIIGVFSPFALPVVALAQNPNNTGYAIDSTNASDILGIISSIFSIVIPILVTFAVIWVIIGVIKYATASDDETQGAARKMIIHAIIALFVIVSIWGLVAILNSTFNIDQSGSNIGVCQPVWDPVDEVFFTPEQCDV